MGTCKLTLNLRGQSGNAELPRAILKGRALHPRGADELIESEEVAKAAEKMWSGQHKVI